ncbi:regulator of nonsense transcripts 2 [Planococcus citri]|uniref:regulator of nonsense transcripts 2 n=1 Tax=Planococcus citri TaxID=170843 RepID=UPI0031F84A83
MEKDIEKSVEEETLQMNETSAPESKEESDTSQVNEPSNDEVPKDDNDAENPVEVENTVNTEALEIEELTSYIQELNSKLSRKESIRHKNQTVDYTESTKSNKDSSLRKNRAFVRKLKTFTESQLDSLLSEMATLNIEKYISEIAGALVEAKLKISDIPAVVNLCSSIHENYPEFSKIFYECWQKLLVVKKDEKIANPSKLRVDLRFYSDLISYGIFPQKDALPLLGNVLTSLISIDKEEHNYSSIILSFCKHCGDDYAGLVPRRIRELSEKYKMEIPRCKILSAEKQKTVKSLLVDYYTSLCISLNKEHKDLRMYEKQNKQILQTKGELSNDRKEKLETMQVSVQKLLTVVQNFAEILDEDMPVLQSEKESKVTDEMTLTEECMDMGPAVSIWDDEETQKFYEKMPDVKEFLPQSKKEADAAKEAVEAPPEEMSDEKLDEEFEKDDVVEEDKSAEVDAGEDEAGVNSNSKTQLETFLNHLPNCINKEMIDNAAIEFLMTHNNKNYRKKLVKALFNVPRTRLDLLPLYSRLVAILHPVMPDVANDLVHLLKNDFKHHFRIKDQINIETKIKVIRFIGELVKFHMYPKYEGLHCLKLLLNDFTHHHIEMACNLLECAGRFFYRHVETRQRTKVYLEQMMRKKCVKNLDNRYVTMIENAYYYVNPPETVSRPVVQLPTLHQFIQKILYQDLNPNDDVETKVLNLMRKLNWKDKTTSDFAIKCLTHAWNVKYQNIRCLANLLAGLVEYQEFVGTRVVDGVLEDIRLGLEWNNPRMNQRRIAMVKYFGELYNYRMVESKDVFTCLYSLITFGVSTPLDPPGNTFRIRLVCVLLETCGQYFNHGLSKTKLDCFFTYFQHYYWLKHSEPIWTADNKFPVQIEYMVRDILTGLRPQVKLSKSFEEAEENVNDLRKKLIAKWEPFIKQTKKEVEGQLSTIMETDTEAKESDSAKEEPDEGDNAEENECDEFDEDEEDDEEYEDDGENVHEMMYREPVRERRIDLEDEEFAEAFDKMVSEDVQDRLRETVRPQQMDISVPYNVRNTFKKNYEQLQSAPDESQKSSVNFVVLLRKGNKQQYKNLEIPLDSDLAKNLKSQEQAEKVELEKVKRLTLDINERLEEEDYQDQIQAYTQKQLPAQSVRDKKKKYQHQKGVPDADLIFGKKRFLHK